MEIEARAKHRLADEYDAAQERGEIRRQADNQLIPDGNKLSTTDLGLSLKDIYEARQFRYAEQAEPGIIRRSLDEKLE